MHCLNTLAPLYDLKNHFYSTLKRETSLNKLSMASRFFTAISLTLCYLFQYCANRFGLHAGAFRQLADFVGDYGKALSRFPGVRRLYRRVYRKQVGLAGDVFHYRVDFHDRRRGFGHVAGKGEE